MNSLWILYLLVLFFENNDCKKISEYFEPTFLYSLNELNEFQRYVLCRYVLLLYDILLRSWPPYPNLESEFLCHFPGPPMIICFPLFYTYSIQLIFQVKKRSIFSCWFQLAFCSVQLALGEFEQSSKDLFYVPYPREVGIFYHIWVGAKNLWNMIERNS